MQMMPGYLVRFLLPTLDAEEDDDDDLDVVDDEDEREDLDEDLDDDLGCLARCRLVDRDLLLVA